MEKLAFAARIPNTARVGMRHYDAVRMARNLPKGVTAPPGKNRHIVRVSANLCHIFRIISTH